jgi:hypothetical protein
MVYLMLQVAPGCNVSNCEYCIENNVDVTDCALIGDVLPEFAMGMEKNYKGLISNSQFLGRN